MGDSINSHALCKAFNANAWLYEKTQDPQQCDLNDQKECDTVEMNCLVSKDVIKEKNAMSFLCSDKSYLVKSIKQWMLSHFENCQCIINAYPVQTVENDHGN